MRLSQGQLNLLETCPPQFQRLYLDQLGSPLSPEQQEKFSWGSRFHLIMQQKELGLPIEPLLQEDEELKRSIDSLMLAAPELSLFSPKSWREAEHYRALTFQNYLLTVVYDLLIADKARAKIFDWKTYLLPEDPTKLEKNWQTRLYLYVLAETSDYSPEQIAMTYWFVKLPSQPQSLTFTYDRLKHEQTRQDLTRLLTRLDRSLEEYLNGGIPFEHFLNCQETCPHYEALLGCEKATTPQEARLDRNWLDSIAEVNLF